MNINLIYIIFFIIFLSGLFRYISNRKHLLYTLLSLEYIVLRLYCFLFYILIIYSFEIYFLIIFLTFRVCEGALGLSILVSIIRSHGNDYFQSFNILIC